MEVIALFFSNKSQKSKNITQKKGSKVITVDEKCADNFNLYSNGVVKELKISINESLLENVIDTDDPILAANEKYKR